MRPKVLTNSSEAALQISGLATGSVKNIGKCEVLLDSEEAARLLRIHPKTLQRMARKGEIPAMQIGKLWRFSPAALLLWQQQKLAE